MVEQHGSGRQQSQALARRSAAQGRPAGAGTARRTGGYLDDPQVGAGQRDRSLAHDGAHLGEAVPHEVRLRRKQPEEGPAATDAQASAISPMVTRSNPWRSEQAQRDARAIWRGSRLLGSTSASPPFSFGHPMPQMEMEQKEAPDEASEDHPNMTHPVESSTLKPVRLDVHRELERPEEGPTRTPPTRGCGALGPVLHWRTWFHRQPGHHPLRRRDERAARPADRQRPPQRRLTAARARWSAGGCRASSKLFLGSMVMKDPPDHRRLRNLVQKAFTPAMVERLNEGAWSRSRPICWTQRRTSPSSI